MPAIFFAEGSPIYSCQAATQARCALEILQQAQCTKSLLLGFVPHVWETEIFQKYFQSIQLILISITANGDIQLTILVESQIHSSDLLKYCDTVVQILQNQSSH